MPHSLSSCRMSRTKSPPLQRALTVELETAEERALVVEALDVKPPLDWAAQSESEQLKRFFAATAFLCSDAISRQAITALAPKYTLRNSEFGTFMACHLGLMAPMLADAVGKEIRAPTAGGKGMKGRGVVDARAANLLSQTYFEAPHNIRHDKFCDRHQGRDGRRVLRVQQHSARVRAQGGDRDRGRAARGREWRQPAGAGRGGEAPAPTHTGGGCVG